MTNEEMISILENDGSIDAARVLEQLRQEWKSTVDSLTASQVQTSEIKPNLIFSDSAFINNTLSLKAASREVRGLHANLFLSHILRQQPNDSSFAVIAAIERELNINIAPILKEMSDERWRSFLLADWSEKDPGYFLKPPLHGDLVEGRADLRRLNQRTITTFFDQGAWDEFLSNQSALRLEFAFLSDLQRFVALAERLPLPRLIYQVIERTTVDLRKLIGLAPPPYNENHWEGNLVGVAVSWRLLNQFRDEARRVSIETEISAAKLGIQRNTGIQRTLRELNQSTNSFIDELLNWSPLAVAEIAARWRWERIWQSRHSQQKAEFDDFIYEQLTEGLAKQDIDPLIVASLPKKGGHSPIERFVHNTEVGILGGANGTRPIHLTHLLVAVDICCDSEFTGPPETKHKIIQLLLDALVKRDAGLKLYGSDLDGLIRAPSREYNCFAYLLKDSENPVEVFQNGVNRFGPHIHRFRYSTPKFDSSAMMGLVWWMIAHLHTVAYLTQSGRENIAIELWDAIFQTALMLVHMEPRFSDKTFGLLELCFRFLPHVLPLHLPTRVRQSCTHIELTAYECARIIAALIDNGASVEDVKKGFKEVDWDAGIARMHELPTFAQTLKRVERSIPQQAATGVEFAGFDEEQESAVNQPEPVPEKLE
jgi:hypothetical protein